MELEPTKPNTMMEAAELMSYVYQIPQQLPARATSAPTALSLHDSSLGPTPMGHPQAQAFIAPPSGQVQHHRFNENHTQGGSSTLVPPGEEHTMALLQSIMWGPGNAARAGGVQRQPQGPPAMGNIHVASACGGAASSAAAEPAGLHGGSLGRVLDLERMPPDHRTGPFGSHTNPQPEFRPAASAGMATVASLGAAAPGSARSAPPGPGPGPEGQLNPWPLKIEALDTYHTASAALQSLGERQLHSLGVTGLQQHPQLNHQQQQPQLGTFSFAPRESQSTTSLSTAPGSSLHGNPDGQGMAAQNLLQSLQLMQQQQQLMQQQQHGRLPLAVDAGPRALNNSSSASPDVPMHDTSALEDALAEARALLEQRARGPAGGGSGGAVSGLGALATAGSERELQLLQHQQQRRESQVAYADGSGVARVSGGDGGGGVAFGAVARHASLGSTVDNAAATRAGAALPALLQHYAGGAAQAAVGGGGGGKLAAMSDPHDPDDDEDEDEEDEEEEDTDPGLPRRRTRKRGMQGGGTRKRGGGGGGGGGSGSSSRGRNQEESKKNVSRERNRTAQRRFRERQREMLRTLQEQVQQRDAVIANLRRQLAVVTAAAVAQGVQLQQLPGLGPQAGQGPHIGRGGAG